MGDHLERRGRQIEGLFGLLDAEAHVLALVPATLFEGVRLEGDERGVVRCRVGGLPAVLVPVSETLHLEVAHFATRWPRWMSDLVGATGEERARALFARAPLIEGRLDTERVKELILAHQIRAEHLFFLGEGPPVGAVPSGDPVAVTIPLPRGAIELAVPRAAFDRAARSRALAPDAEVHVSWNGAPLALAGAAQPWHDEERAELAVVATMQLQGGARDEVLRLLEAALPDEGRALPNDAALGTILNVWGVALRQKGELPRAIAMLERVHAFAPEVDAQLEQQAAYNLGYAKLETTMTRRAPVGRRGGVGLVSARYDLDPKHRARWTECLALFERALALDPQDETARAQVEQVQKLLGLLASAPEGGESGGAASGGKKGPKKSARAAAAATQAATPVRTSEWLPPALVSIVLVCVVIGLVAVMCDHERERERQQASVPPPSSAPAAPPAPSARALALASLALDALPEPTPTPCGVSIAVPDEVPRGEVVAPVLGRALLTGELYGTDDFDATIRQWAGRFAPGLEVVPASAAGVGPITGEPGVEDAWRMARIPVTLVVREWRDPVVMDDGSSVVPGRAAGVALAWSATAERFVCAAPFDVENGRSLSITRSTDLSVPEDDPLNRARLDLIEQAARAAIPSLRALPE